MNVRQKIQSNLSSDARVGMLSKREAPTSLLVYSGIMLLLFCSCEGTRDDGTSKNEGVIESPKESSAAEIENDKTQKDSHFVEPHLAPKKLQTNPTKTIHPQTSPEQENGFEDVRDDPNYVGTPCNYVNGQCIRHKHKSLSADSDKIK